MLCGIVGLPLSGKSSLFELLTGSTFQAGADHKPRRGIAQLPDPRLDQISALIGSAKTTHATVEFLDLPGSRPGEDREREPYPPAILGELKTADILILTVREFANPAVPHLHGSVDPVRDIKDALLEFFISDLATIERRLEKLAKLHDPSFRKEADLLKTCHDALSNNTPLRNLEFSAQEEKLLRAFSFLSLKPLMVVANLGERSASNPEACLETILKQIQPVGNRLDIGFAAVELELELRRLDSSDREAFRSELGLTDSAGPRIINQVSRLLGLVTFITAGDTESRAWTIRSGSNAVTAAEAIHEDIGRGFIRAEVCDWEDLVEAGSHARLRDTGKLRLEGKEYIVKDGDVLNIRFAGPTK